MQHKTLLINQDQIKKLCNMEKCIELCTKTFLDLGQGKTINPTKVTLDLGESADFPPYDGFANAMPAYIGWQDRAGIKWVSGIGGKRREVGLPFINGIIVLMHPELGEFLGIMDGQYITNLRTGAQTAVALKNIFKGKESINVGIYGAGTQGRTQLEGIANAFDVKRLVIYDIFPEASKKYKEDMASYVSGEIEVADKPEDVCVDVDAVITVTQAKDGFLKPDWVKPGTVVFPMGSYDEVDDEVILQADYIVVDHIQQAMHRGALKALNEQGKINESDITATISELAADKKKIDKLDEKRGICIPIGMGALDVTVANYVYDQAIEQDIGEYFEFQ